MEYIQKKYLFVTIRRNSLANIDEFVSVWSKGYNYPNMGSYNDIIPKKQLDVSDLLELFNWKNGMSLSSKKTNSLEQKILSKISVINQLIL